MAITIGRSVADGDQISQSGGAEPRGDLCVRGSRLKRRPEPHHQTLALGIVERNLSQVCPHCMALGRQC
jgi:hypothetical protein